jgi:hypothetical protein
MDIVGPIGDGCETEICEDLLKLSVIVLELLCDLECVPEWDLLEDFVEVCVREGVNVRVILDEKLDELLCERESEREFD